MTVNYLSIFENRSQTAFAAVRERFVFLLKFILTNIYFCEIMGNVQKKY